jgi:ferric iron reductase protein FhuF
MAATGVSEALSRAAEVGPYFGLDSDAGAGWLPFRVLLDDPGVLAERVRLVRTTLAAQAGVAAELVEERACASIHFLALTARVLAPALGAAAVAALVPDVGPDQIGWRPVDGGPIPMSWAEPTGHPATTAAQAAAGIDSGVLNRVIAPLAERFATSFHLSAQVLRGNAASALAGAAAMLTRSGQDLRLDPVEIVTAALQSGALAGTGAYRRTTAGAEPAFVRATCCLFYRIPGGGLCGDCVLATRGAPGAG